MGRRDESGATIVLVALLVTVMLIIVAIVLDGGQAYADRRRMQNAADAAALAGARTLGQVRLSGATVDLLGEVRAVAVANGASATDLLTCDVVDAQAATLAPCSPNTSWSGRSDAAGVRVTAGLRRTQVFGSFTGQTSLVVRASAAATLQPLLSLRTPWMICGSTGLGGFDLVDPATRTLRPDATLRAAYGAGGTALGDSRGIPLYGTPTNTCGLGPAWQGLVSPAAQPVQLGALTTAAAGTTSGAYAYDDVLPGTGGCPANFTDGMPSTCNAVVPVFDEVNTATGSARIVAFAVWKLQYASSGTVRWFGQFVSSGVASGGVTSDGPVTGRSTYVVRIAA